MDTELKYALELLQQICLDHKACRECPLAMDRDPLCVHDPCTWTDEDIETAHSRYVSDKTGEHY